MTLSNKTSMPKLLYVVGMRGVSILAKSIGLLTMLDRRREKRVYHWLRSLFAIHDLDAMVDLDVPWWTYGAIDAVVCGANPGFTGQSSRPADGLDQARGLFA